MKFSTKSILELRKLTLGAVAIAVLAIAAAPFFTPEQPQRRGFGPANLGGFVPPTQIGSGGVSDGDKGDITVTASGATWDIDSGVVGVAELADNLDLSGNGSTTLGDTRLKSTSPSAISGTVNDWAVSSTATVVFATSSSTATVNSIASPAADRYLKIINVGSNGIFYAHEGTGTLANKLSLCAGDNWNDIGGRNDSIEFVYDATISRWRQICRTTMARLYVLGSSTFSGAIVAGGNLTVSGVTSATGDVDIGDAEADKGNVYGKPYTRGTAPVLSTCGTTPSIVGNDKAGAVTMGTGSPSACTLTFNTAWTTNAPICIVSGPVGTALGKFVNITTKSTSAFAIGWADSAGAAVSCNSCVFEYHCMGRL